MMPNIDNKINLIRYIIIIVVDPPPPPIMANADTGATDNYLTPYDAHVLVNLQPTNMGPQVRLPDNSIMDPQQVDHLPLALPPLATETHVFQYLKKHI